MRTDLSLNRTSAREPSAYRGESTHRLQPPPEEAKEEAACDRETCSILESEVFEHDVRLSAEARDLAL